jgi:DNA-binding MarR family transcriptional regulator
MPTYHKGTPQEVQALDTFIKLTRATDSLQARLARRETFGDLTPRQFGVLETLYHLGPMRQGEICAKLLKSGGNITLVVDNLEKRGLVRRQRDSEADHAQGRGSRAHTVRQRLDARKTAHHKEYGYVIGCAVLFVVAAFVAYGRFLLVPL